MDNDERLAVPPLGKERHIWHIPEDAPVSRSRRSRGNGEYESAVPIRLADLHVGFPSEMLADLCEQLDEARADLYGVRSDAAVWRVLPNLIAQPIINTRYLQKTLGLSKPQAERAIKTLTERGVVVARTGKQRNVVYEHRGILDVLDEYAAGLRRG